MKEIFVANTLKLKGQIILNLIHIPVMSYSKIQVSTFLFHWLFSSSFICLHHFHVSKKSVTPPRPVQPCCPPSTPSALLYHEPSSAQPIWPHAVSPPRRVKLRLSWLDAVHPTEVWVGTTLCRCWRVGELISLALLLWGPLLGVLGRVICVTMNGFASQCGLLVLCK